jgi:hypothetical protein
MIMEKAYHQHLKKKKEENRHQKQVKKEDKAVKKEDKAVKMNLRIA